MVGSYDAVVVGARCAGSPTAMLLARTGYRVLLVDRATFPSDTVSTHFVHAPGVASLERWGLRERLAATGCPPLDKYTYDFGFLELSGSPAPVDGVGTAYCPRRTVLDKLLVDAAAEAGAEVREGFVVDELLFEDGGVAGIRGRSKTGGTATERARVVVGADGRNSFVARSVDAPRYNERPELAGAYYTYFDGLPTDGSEFFIRPEFASVANPTNDGLTMIVVGWPVASFRAARGDIEGTYLRALDSMPIGERIRVAERADRFYGMAVSSFFRQPYGPGWALVGDAGYTKDPVTALGITDAFADAERCANGLDAWLSGRRPYDEAMGDYQRARDEHAGPIYELTCFLASFEPPGADMQQLLAGAAGDQERMDAFVGVMATTIPVSAFFS